LPLAISSPIEVRHKLGTKFYKSKSGMKNLNFRILSLDICGSTQDDTRHRTESCSGI